jgi:hypothetical protein
MKHPALLLLLPFLGAAFAPTLAAQNTTIAAGVPDPCSIVTPAEAAAALGTAVGPGKQRATDKGKTCGYIAAGGKTLLTLGVYHLEGDPKKLDLDQGHSETPIDWRQEAGLGDEARSMARGSMTQFNVIKGHTALMLQLVVAGSESSYDRAKRAVTAAAARLP